MDSIKFDADDMELIRKIQNDYIRVTADLGQLEIEKRVTMKRLEMIDVTKDEILKKYDEVRENEQKMIQEFNTKYGDGVLDLESGTFQPNPSEIKEQ
jgi:hypothetical protein